MQSDRVVVADVALQLPAERGLGAEGGTTRALRLARVEERFRVCVVAGAPAERGYADVRAGPAGGACDARPRRRPSRASFRHWESMKG